MNKHTKIKMITFNNTKEKDRAEQQKLIKNISYFC